MRSICRRTLSECLRLALRSLFQLGKDFAVALPVESVATVKQQRDAAGESHDGSSHDAKSVEGVLIQCSGDRLEG